MEGDFYSWGLSIGSIRGIRIRLHWILLLFWFFQLNDYWETAVERDVSRALVLGLWATYVGLTFATILLHEFGHCAAARRMGGDADEVLLWPLGGLAMVRVGSRWWPRLVVSAAGPMVHALLLPVCWLTFHLLGPPNAWSTAGLYRLAAEDALVHFQLYILLFNLVPLYPLDGGSIFRCLTEAWLERRGHPAPSRQATFVTVRVSYVIAAAGAVWALVRGDLFLLCICAWAAHGAWQLDRGLREGAVEESSFLGHDFSNGYTSLERGGRRPRAGARDRRSGPGPLARLLGRGAPTPEERARDEQRLDALLEKISREGMGALSRRERRFLDKMSRRKGRG